MPIRAPGAQGAPGSAEPGASGIPTGSLGRAAVSGVAWQGLSFLLGKLLVLVTTVVLARLLTPNDFGVVGLALVFINYADVVTDLGVAQALVFFPASRNRNDAALIVSIAVAGILFCGALLAAPTVSGFFGRPDVTPLFQVLALSLLLRGFGQVPDALLRKSLRFRQRLMAELGRAVGQGAVSIALALLGLGPWALVYGYLIGSAIWSASAWWLADYLPGRGSLHLHWPIVRALLGYGLPAAGTAWVLNLVFNVDYLIVGRLLGAEALGYYTVGFRVPETVIINVFTVLSAVAFPVFSWARADRPRFRQGYLFSLQLQAVYGVGAGVALAAVAPVLVEAVFGARWRPAAVPLQALALYAAFRSLGMGATDLLKSVGRTGLLLCLAGARLAAVVPALIFATRWGINGVSWAQAAVALPLSLLIQWVASRELGLSTRAVAAALMPSVAIGLGVASGALLGDLLVPGPAIVRLVVSLTGAGICGLAVLYATDRRLLRRATELVLSRGQTVP